ncbi:MAG: 50S ribosomal protein L15 [Dehalococcoidia bacterium]|nr:50S ribosomal protein L15 [Chloroflexota bacterium]MBT9159442.1 50S ribosomal protein L15 [Chloroflexota bacterium]MBT9162799.1 50S ribosomal protein L15 [Chloroflexota bacterium]
MKQNELRPAAGSKHKRKRVGRGPGSGHGTYSCRGIKGQKSRSGGGVRPLFEGGQNPLAKRLPYKRGFTNIFRTEYAIVNVERLNVFPEGAEVTPQELVSAGILKGLSDPIKILGQGELTHQLVVKANKFSQAAKNKIEGAGGRVEVIT